MGARPLKIDPDWWKSLFDQTYLVTDARSVCDDRLTRREVDMVEDVMGLKTSHPILDLCGGHGRHALELFRRGFRDVTVVDYSGFLLDLGRENAATERASINFVNADARDTGLPDHSFRAVMVMANSFGYFLDPADDEKLLWEAYRLLAPGGILLLDLVDREFIVNEFKPLSWHEADGEIVVCRERELEGDLVISREMVLSKKDGLLRDKKYCVRLYGREEIGRLLDFSGFSRVRIRNGYNSHDRDGDYGFLTNRMIVTAQKPA